MTTETTADLIEDEQTIDERSVASTPIFTLDGESDPPGSELFRQAERAVSGPKIREAIESI